MARKRTPCEFCAEERWWSSQGRSAHELYIECYPENNCIGITSFGPDANEEIEELREELPMNFCPGCGRDLRT